LNKNIQERSNNFKYFLSKLDNKKFITEFEVNGSSNYSFILMIREGNPQKSSALEELLNRNEIEFRRGSACGGNHLRQPYLKDYLGDQHPGLKDFSNAEYAHFFGYYLGNFPSLENSQIDWLCKTINTVEFK
jgi:CDP-6-deoxy-D-xylo-4-hexulose-3-dehydrase